MAAYASIWFLAFIGASLVFVPAAALAAVCVAVITGDLNPLAVGVVAGSAEALGELTGYAAGRGGKEMFKRTNNKKLLCRGVVWISSYSSF